MAPPKHAWVRMRGGEMALCRRCGLRRDWKELEDGGMGWVYSRGGEGYEERPSCKTLAAADFEQPKKETP